MSLTVSDRFLFLADGTTHGVQAWALDGTLRHAGALVARFREAKQPPADLAAGKNGEVLVLDSVGQQVLRVEVNF